MSEFIFNGLIGTIYIKGYLISDDAYVGILKVGQIYGSSGGDDGTVNVACNLNVAKNLEVQENIAVAKNLEVQGNIAVAKNLEVQGNIAVAKDLEVQEKLKVNTIEKKSNDNDHLLISGVIETNSLSIHANDASAIHTVKHGTMAVGFGCTASGNHSFAAGFKTKATAVRTFSTGHQTDASGECSFTQGFYTKAGGKYAAAFGEYTVANNMSEFTCGKYNTKSNISSDDGKIFVVGNGTADNSRSDAFFVKTNGDAVVAGTLTANSLFADSLTANNLFAGSLTANKLTVSESIEVPTLQASNTLKVPTLEAYWITATTDGGQGFVKTDKIQSTSINTNSIAVEEGVVADTVSAGTISSTTATIATLTASSEISAPTIRAADSLFANWVVSSSTVIAPFLTAGEHLTAPTITATTELSAPTINATTSLEAPTVNVSGTLTTYELNGDNIYSKVYSSGTYYIAEETGSIQLKSGNNMPNIYIKKSSVPRDSSWVPGNLAVEVSYNNYKWFIPFRDQTKSWLFDYHTSGGYNTISHITVIDNLELAKIGQPVFLSDKFYKKEQVELKCVYTESDVVIDNSTCDDYCQEVSIVPNNKFVGVICKVSTKVEEEEDLYYLTDTIYDDTYNKPVISFATHGDYAFYCEEIFDSNNNPILTKGQVLTEEIKNSIIGQEITYYGLIIDDDTIMTKKLMKSNVGTITDVLTDDNLFNGYMMVFKTI